MEQGVSLGKGGTRYLLVQDSLQGRKYIEKGPCTFFPGPHESVLEQRDALPLTDKQYVKIKDSLTGQGWVQRGPALVYLEPGWTLLTRSVQDAIPLKAWEYVQILDKKSGAVRTVQGEALVFLEAHEEVEGGVQQAGKVDATHAVLVRDRLTGQQRLETKPQLFFPGATEEVLEVRELTTLEEHEACVVRDEQGQFKFHGCNIEGSQSAFFLPPHCELLQLNWSRGRRRERRDLYINKVDCRPQYMSFEFNCRTSDNVELVLEGTFFWQVVDVRAMVANTGDTTGDICSHARSRFIQLISREALQDFMNNFNGLAGKVCDGDDFYSQRGVKIHTLEVTGYRCADKSTANILQAIIQETTNRMNRLSQQESENEVKMFKLQGDIEQAKIKKQLQDSEASIEGAAEAQKAKSFLAGITEQVPQVDARIQMWNTLRKGGALADISNASSTSVYFTPADCNLSIEQK